MRCLQVLALGLLTFWRSSGAWAEVTMLLGEQQQVVVDLMGGLPVRWVSCADGCAGGSGPRQTMLGVGEGGGRLRWDVPGDPSATRALESLAYAAEVAQTSRAAVVTLTSREPFQGTRLIHRYDLALAGYTLSVSLQVPAGARLVLESGQAFVPEPLPGFARMYGDVDAVRITATGQRTLAREPAAPDGVPIASGQWVGVRNRFWALLMRPATDVTVDVGLVAPDRPRLGIEDGHGAGTLDAMLYGGPVERGRLTAVDPMLDGLLFAALWDWLRALCFALLSVLERWDRVVGSHGVAVLLLSLSVRILTWPITAVAGRWQGEVDRIRNALRPDLEAVRREFRGEEAHRRTLEVYRRHGVSPLFPVRSLLGVLIQIPIFIAAFDMLGQNFALNGVSFLWIRDLALPDRWRALPATLPLFGRYVNLLPFLMLALAVLAARLETDPARSGALRTGQRRNLYAMAAVFFVVLYSFPAGMVLYWTSNNLWHLLGRLGVRMRARAR